MTFLFGITMSLILVSFHRYRLKKNGIQKITAENVGVNQRRSLKSKSSKSQLIKKPDPIIGKMKMTETENGILLKTGMTWKSWVEEIKIIQQANEEYDFDYQITSRPNLITTLVDYAKNLENVDKIEKVIKNIA
ncbi:hypothetical protein EI546_11440 [Aequorivita sp. H23M31]|uniref:Uncharacterized protein n=1 Tax=Aequorivita ciconiae TaxID=2494375 RepID=A0A410G4T4_9FLAO|nr:hypothetical protein [Aequorivita sp. H23M31]QAA82294.1 hypothetical protein EI546_11440 [Aequorivita sp. H23M31]